MFTLIFSYFILYNVLGAIKGCDFLKLKSIYSTPENTILKSIHSYKKKIMDTSNLSLGITHHNHTYTAQLIDWIDSTIVFEILSSEGHTLILSNGTNLNVTFISKAVLFHTGLTVTKCSRENNLVYYFAEINSPIIKQQKRNAFRLDVLLDVQYNVLSDDDHILKSNKGTCVNISIGGMCLLSKEALEPKDKLYLSFSLSNKSLSFNAEVLCVDKPNEQGQYIHHIHFLDLDDDIEQLNKLIFEKQRLQLKRS